MVAAIRILTVLSLVLLLAASLLPFEHPLNVDVPLDQPPPKWLLSVALLLAALLIGAASSVGLLRLRRWGRLLATAASVLLLLALWLLSQSPLAGAMSGLGAVLTSAGALAWLCGVALSYHPLAAQRFRP